MLIVGKDLCARFKMINLHPALPGGPIGTWQQVIWQLIETNTMETGAMMHLVTPDLDRGPAISYYTFKIQKGDLRDLWKDDDKDQLFAAIREQGVKRELPLILLTLKEFAGGNIEINDEKVYSHGQLLTQGYDLTNEIEDRLMGRNKE
jgi:phosphoribosylglycinamide formyltransferase-1